MEENSSSIQIIEHIISLLKSEIPLNTEQLENLQRNYQEFKDNFSLDCFMDLEGESDAERLQRYRMLRETIENSWNACRKELCPLISFAQTLEQLSSSIDKIHDEIYKETTNKHYNMQQLLMEKKKNIVVDQPIIQNGIQVKTLTGKTIKLDLNPNFFVLDLKKKIHEKEGIPPDQQRLIHNGKNLHDEDKLFEYRVKEGDSIHLLLGLRGGKPVILLYDEDENVEKKEVSIKLTLNEAMNIGATYPHPTFVNQTTPTMKEYEWKGTYSSKGKNACQLVINDKKYDYVFWEGPCMKESEFNGQVIGITADKFEEELDMLLEKLGLNERERNDFIVYWLTKLSGRKGHKVTICDEKYDNEIAKLEVTGYSQQIRVMLKFEEVSEEEVNQLKGIESVEVRKRPTGKYVVEWGAILA